MTITTRVTYPVYVIENGKLVRTSECVFFVLMEEEGSEK